MFYNQCHAKWVGRQHLILGRLGTVTVTGIIVSVHLKKLTGKPIYSKEFLSFEV